MAPSVSVQIASADGYSLHCQFWEAEKPKALLILLHGVISHSEWLDNVCAQLASNGVSCLSPDRRGCGKNLESRGDAPSAEALISDIDALLHWARLQNLPIHACGFCWGANYWVNYLERHSDTCNSVALFAPSLFPSEVITQQPFNTGTTSIADQVPLIPLNCFTDTPQFSKYIQEDPWRLRLVSARFNRIMAEFSQGLWMKFLRLRLPVLVVLATKDEVVDNRATKSVVGRFNNSPCRLVELNAKHGIQFDACSELVSELQSWLNKYS